MKKLRPRRTKTPQPERYLVYVRLGLGYDEPLVAVVGTADDARALDKAVRARYPHLEVGWEAVNWFGADESTTADPRAGELVHIVLTGTEDNEGGVAIYADEAAARQVVRAAQARGGDYHLRSADMGAWLSTQYPMDE